MSVWVIVYQWRKPQVCDGDQRDWRSWRNFAAIGITFADKASAEAYLEAMPDPFINLRDRGLRKLSCSVSDIRSYRKRKRPW